jgi:hypothetical protein
MKKMILSFAFLMTAFFSQVALASSSTPPMPFLASNLEQAFEFNKGVKEKGNAVFDDRIEFTTDGECSVTMKGTIDLGAFEAEISCTTTAQTCQEATTLAISCIKATVKAARTILL